MPTNRRTVVISGESVRPFYYDNPEYAEYCRYTYGGSGVLIDHDGLVFYCILEHTTKGRKDFDNIRVPINSDGADALTWDIIKQHRPNGASHQQAMLNHYISELRIIEVENSTNARVPGLARLRNSKTDRPLWRGTFMSVGYPRDGVFEALDVKNERLTPKRVTISGSYIARDLSGGGPRKTYDGTSFVNIDSKMLTTPGGIHFPFKPSRDLNGICGGGVFDVDTGDLLGLIVATDNDHFRFIDWSLLGTVIERAAKNHRTQADCQSLLGGRKPEPGANDSTEGCPS